MYNYLIIFCFTLFYTSVFYPRNSHALRGCSVISGPCRSVSGRRLPDDLDPFALPERPHRVVVHRLAADRGEVVAALVGRREFDRDLLAFAAPEVEVAQNPVVADDLFDLVGHFARLARKPERGVDDATIFGIDCRFECVLLVFVECHGFDFEREYWVVPRAKIAK